MLKKDQKSSQPDLKTCPFCGKAAVFSSFNGSESSGLETFFHVSCHPCGVIISGSSEAEVISKWNTRIFSVNEDVFIDIPLRSGIEQAAFQQGEQVSSNSCSTCRALLEIGSLFCSHCRATDFSQFLAPLAESGKEIPLPLPGQEF